jgi:nucleotide-binding universal stress UspA family protein
MYKNVLLVRNGCEGCSMETCLGVLLAESLNAKVTAVYATGSFTGQELRKICGADELKWPGAGRAGKEAMAVSEEREARLAKEALESTEKMCADRRVPCETVHYSSRSPLHCALEVAEEKKCDVIVTSIQPHLLAKPLYDIREGNGHSKIPVLFHYAA